MTTGKHFLIILSLMWLSSAIMGMFLVVNTPNPDPLLNVFSFLVGSTLVFLIYTGILIYKEK